MRDLDDPNNPNNSDNDMEALLARARRGWSPNPGDAERVRRGLEAALARGAAAPATPAPSRGTHPWMSRVMVTAAFTAAGAAGGYWAGRRASPPAAPPPAAVAAPARPSHTAPIAPPAISSGRPSEPAHPAPAASSPGRRVEPGRRRAVEGAAPATAESLAAEVRGLRNVERALRDHNAGLATAYLDDLDREVPGGQMREERVALRAIARCARGAQPFGVNLAQDFAATYPASPYRARVEQACSGTDSAGTGD